MAMAQEDQRFQMKKSLVVPQDSGANTRVSMFKVRVCVDGMARSSSSLLVEVECAFRMLFEPAKHLGLSGPPHLRVHRASALVRVVVVSQEVTKSDVSTTQAAVMKPMLVEVCAGDSHAGHVSSGVAK